MGDWNLYLGEYDAATNLAFDELLLEKASRQGQKSMRIYDFEDPAVILARNEHPEDIKEWRNDVEYTRRDSGGSVIYCDENAIYYSIAVPADRDDFPEELHRDFFGSRIAEALASAGVPEEKLGVGEHFSVRIDNKTVSGNSQRKKGDALLYHGIIAYESWDADFLDEIIQLREKEEELEREFIESLPGLTDYTDSSRDEVVDQLINSFTEGAYEVSELNDEELERLNELSQRYRDEDWIKGNDAASLNNGQGFCFVDWTDEWNEDVRDYGFY